jgi:PAS domain S-box-containing protein
VLDFFGIDSFVFLFLSRSSKKTVMEKSKFLKSESGNGSNESESKLMEETKFFLASIVESSGDSIITINFDEKITSWNRAAEELYGYPAAEAIGKPLTMLTLPEDLMEVLSNINKIKHSETVEVFDTIRIHKDGQQINLEIVLSPVRDSAGKVIGVSTIARDITERKRQEAELAKLNARIERQAQVFNTTLSTITDFAYTFDRDGRFIYANRRLCDLLGITCEEIIGKNFFDLNYPDDLAAKLQRQIQKVFDTGESVRDETPFTSPAGAEGFYEYIFSPFFSADGSVELVAGSTRDVTDRKSAEESIRFQAHLLNTVEQSVIATDLDGTVIYWNHFAEKLYGWTAKEAMGRSITDLIMPDIMAEQAAEIMSLLRKGKSWSGEFQVRRRDGTTFPAQVFNSPIEDGQGNLIGIVGVSIDITERNQAQQALSKSEERLRLLIESASDYAIFTITKDNVIDSWNTGAEKVFGWTESEALGQSGKIIFLPEDREACAPEQEIETALINGRAPDERFHLRRDGSRFYASGVMTLLKDEVGRVQGFAKILRDMTERVAAEKAIRDKEMLKMLVAAQEDERKRIARDLHDELGQQLTALRLKLEALKKMCDDDELCGKIDETQLIAKRIDSGVDFLAWELRPAALDDLGLFAALEKYIREWSHHSGVTAELLASGLKRARFAPDVETNLYRIVQEALNNTHKHANAKSVEVMLEKRGDLIVLIIEDDGKGFDVKKKANLSKRLGLIGMRERATLIGGTMEIESAPGQGTTIYIRILAKTLKKRGSNEK